MGTNEPSFTLGVEEEYLLVDKETGDLVIDPPETLMAEAEEKCGPQVTSELLRSQIEVGTRVCKNIKEVREDLSSLRRSVIEVANNHGLAPIAASTHPFSSWTDQKHTEKDRYDQLTHEMQGAARRLLICGMHVHVGIDDDELRIDLMNQMSYFLPHLLALSCSSPFWMGRDTGLKSYRLTIFDALPRTGVPERFASFAEFKRHVAIMQNAGLIEDSTRIWWDLRPSGRFPTLETRIMDVCTRIDDTIALTALLACIMRMLYRLRTRNQRWRLYTPMLIRENRWRAMRYSFDEGLIDLAKGTVVPFTDLVDELCSLIAEDARALGCEKEVKGMSVVKTLIQDTAEGL
jgi:carboxylate-amine ligase